MKTVTRHKVSRQDGTVSYYFESDTASGAVKRGVIHFSRNEVEQGRVFMADRLRKFRKYLSTIKEQNQ